MNDQQSLLTDELSALVGVDGAPYQVAVDELVLRRVLETMAEDNQRWRGDLTPPYILMAFEKTLPLPETPEAPESLVTGDEWALVRPVRLGEPISVTGRLASATERFGSRFGHTLNLRTTWTFTDVDGAVVAEVGRGTIRYRPPQGPGVGGRGSGIGVDLATDEPLRSVPHPPTPDPRPPRSEGDALPETVIRPGIGQVVRYAALTWNFVPFFFDAEAARRAGLPGTIVPGPLKLALLTQYLDWVAGPDGAVRSVRCAHRRPDPTGRPLTIRGVVSRAEDGAEGRTLDCEVWMENERGERSVVSSATIVTGARGPLPG